jgi:hypothetical protein
VSKPVFNDETGRRAAVLLWVGRVVVAAGVILTGAIAFTLTTHIALPGLDGLVTPTLNGSQPEVALPTDPGTVHFSDTPNTDVPDPTAKPRRAKSASSPSLRSTAVAAGGRRVVKSPTTATTRPAPTASTQRTTKPRNSNAASPTRAGRNVRPTGHPTPPGQTKKPVS